MFAQIPDPTDVIQHASNYSWEAGLLAFIVVTGFISVGWMLKVIMQRHLTVEERTLNDAKEREVRLSGRVTTLEDLVRTELLNLIRANSETMGKVLGAADSICRASERMVQTLDRFTAVLDVRPCLLSTAAQLRIIEKKKADSRDQSCGQ
jgi:hypothetical protein